MPSTPDEFRRSVLEGLYDAARRCSGTDLGVLLVPRSGGGAISNDDAIASTTFHLHSLIVAPSSRYFAEPNFSRVIEDVDPDAFAACVKFMYTGELDGDALSCDNFAAILHAAELLQINELRERCIEYCLEERTKLVDSPNCPGADALRQSLVQVAAQLKADLLANEEGDGRAALTRFCDNLIGLNLGDDGASESSGGGVENVESGEEEVPQQLYLDAPSSLITVIASTTAALDTATGAASIIPIKQEKDTVAALRADLENARGDLEIAKETVEQQARATDIWQSRFDELASLAKGKVDGALISEIRNRSLASEFVLHENNQKSVQIKQDGHTPVADNSAVDNSVAATAVVPSREYKDCEDRNAYNQSDPLGCRGRGITPPRRMEEVEQQDEWDGEEKKEEEISQDNITEALVDSAETRGEKESLLWRVLGDQEAAPPVSSTSGCADLTSRGGGGFGATVSVEPAADEVKEEVPDNNAAIHTLEERHRVVVSSAPPAAAVAADPLLDIEQKPARFAPDIELEDTGTTETTPLDSLIARPYAAADRARARATSREVVSPAMRTNDEHSCLRNLSKAAKKKQKKQRDKLKKQQQQQRAAEAGTAPDIDTALAKDVVVGNTTSVETLPAKDTASTKDEAVDAGASKANGATHSAVEADEPKMQSEKQPSQRRDTVSTKDDAADAGVPAPVPPLAEGEKKMRRTKRTKQQQLEEAVLDDPATVAENAATETVSDRAAEQRSLPASLTTLGITTLGLGLSEKERERRLLQEAREKSAAAKAKKKSKKSRKHDKWLQEQEAEKTKRREEWQGKIDKEREGVHLVSQLVASELLRQNKGNTKLSALTRAQVLEDSQAADAIEAESKKAHTALFGGLACRVKVAGLDRKDLNGRQGTLRSWDADKGLFSVGLDTKKGADIEERCFKPEDLEAISSHRPGKGDTKSTEGFNVEISDLCLAEGKGIGCQFTLDKSMIASLRFAKSIDDGLEAFCLARDEEERQQRIEAKKERKRQEKERRQEEEERRQDEEDRKRRKEQEDGAGKETERQTTAGFLQMRREERQKIRDEEAWAKMEAQREARQAAHWNKLKGLERKRMRDHFRTDLIKVLREGGNPGDYLDSFVEQYEEEGYVFNAGDKNHFDFMIGEPLSWHLRYR